MAVYDDRPLVNGLDRMTSRRMRSSRNRASSIRGTSFMSNGSEIEKNGDHLSIRLPDGSVRQVATGSTGADLAKSISQGLYRKAVGLHLNGELRDLFTPLAEGDE